MSFELAPYTFTQFFVEKSHAKCSYVWGSAHFRPLLHVPVTQSGQEGSLAKSSDRSLCKQATTIEKNSTNWEHYVLDKVPAGGHYTHKPRVEFTVTMGMPAVAFVMLMHQLACWPGFYVPTARLQMNNHHTWCRELILWLSFKNRPGANCDPRLECHSLRTLPDHKKTLGSFSCDWRMDLSTCKYSEDKAPIPWS